MMTAAKKGSIECLLLRNEVTSSASRSHPLHVTCKSAIPRCINHEVDRRTINMSPGSFSHIHAEHGCARPSQISSRRRGGNRTFSLIMVKCQRSIDCNSDDLMRITTIYEKVIILCCPPYFFHFFPKVGDELFNFGCTLVSTDILCDLPT